MALKYNVEYNNTTVIGERQFKFRPWTTKNEKDYLIAVESEKDIDDNMIFDILIRPCLEDPEIMLSANEQKMLIIAIRKKSLGSTFPMRYVCNKCSQVNDIDVDFDKIVKFTPDNFSNVTVEEGMEFEFGPIASENLKRRLDDLEYNVDYAFTDFLLHIQSITIKGTKEDSFTFDELKSFVEDLPTYIFDEVFKEYQVMKSKLDFEFTTLCMMCDGENDIEFEHIPNFLWQ